MIVNNKIEGNFIYIIMINIAFTLITLDNLSELFTIVGLQNNSQFATEIINFYYFPTGFT